MNVAVIVPTPGATVSEAELDAYCLSTMARYKRPKEYRFVDSLPINNYGKIVKRELRDLLRSETR